MKHFFLRGQEWRVRDEVVLGARTRFRLEDPATGEIIDSLCTPDQYEPLVEPPVPHVDDVRQLPRIQMRHIWAGGTRHVTDDEENWEQLWRVEKAVADSYGPGAEDLDHILHAFPVFARKRRKFMTFLRKRTVEWQATKRV